MDLNAIIHPKEKIYFTILLVVSIIIWLPLVSLLFLGVLKGMLLFTIIFVLGLIIGFVLWLISLYFEAILFGNTVEINENQYPDLNNIVKDYTNRLGMYSKPKVFIYNGEGMVNAFAVRFLSKKYIILMGDLVDLMLERKKIMELNMIIGHEIGHHYAQHTALWKKILLKPGKVVPFIGNAYNRACELTADRIGYVLVKDLKSAQRGLISLSLGSKTLANGVNIQEFMNQDKKVPTFMGFIYKIFSSHPRMTRRVIELANFSRMMKRNY